MEGEKKATRNKTITVSSEEVKILQKRLFVYSNQEHLPIDKIINKTIFGNSISILRALPSSIFDLIIIDPPYNLDKNFNGFKFKASDDDCYTKYLENWFSQAVRTLKPDGSLYLCGDWKNSACLYMVMNKYLNVINRITWQREKGRGAKKNWKNSMEDIWFGVKDKKNYYFNVEAVKMKRRVLAPYKKDGKPKDWIETKEGKFRLTYPSNFWDDISIPYWSMPENTIHPTQKPEKLIAKLILASCPEGGLVLDPFLGSGTTSVVAKKLNINYVGIEFNKEYAILAEKRLDLAEKKNTIQGYSDKVFWERNTFINQKKSSN